MANSIIKICEHCGKSFHPQYKYVKRDDAARFCGRACYGLQKIEHSEDRFWSFVNKSEGCWEWQGGKTRQGYGLIYFKGRRWAAHRLSYFLNVSQDIENLFVCHRCDNPQCVRPDHLFLGTPLDNVRDMIQKNRSRKGETHGQAKLTNIQVQEIREIGKGMTQKEIAAKYGIRQDSVSRILSGKRYSSA